MKVKGSEYMEDREAVLTAFSPESGNVHQSYETEDGKIIAWEFIPDNYPQGAFYACNTAEEYFKGLKEVDWIEDNARVSSKYEEMFDRIQNLGPEED